MTIAKVATGLIAGFALVAVLFGDDRRADDSDIVSPVAAQQGVAIEGYDPVAYFTDGVPVEGVERFSATWRGAEWRFATLDNRSIFVADPDRYAPRFGGYAVETVANGKAFPGDPEIFKIREGRLYLSRSPKSQTLWLRNPDGYIGQAEAAWAETCEWPLETFVLSVNRDAVIPYC